jgi:hypothetical protein
MLKKCKVCGLEKEPIQGIWVMKHGKPEGRTCLACASAAAKIRCRQIRATPEGLEARREASRKLIANSWYNKYDRQRRAIDPLYKLAGNLRSLIIMSMKQKGFKKNTKSEKLVGCSFEHLLAHLQSTLPDWESHDVIHIDHVIPVSAAEDEVEMVALQHWSNLQWLPGSENLKKSDARPEGWEERMMDLVHHTHG